MATAFQEGEDLCPRRGAGVLWAPRHGSESEWEQARIRWYAWELRGVLWQGLECNPNVQTPNNDTLAAFAVFIKIGKWCFANVWKRDPGEHWVLKCLVSGCCLLEYFSEESVGVFLVSLIYLGLWKQKLFYKKKPYYCVQFWERCCMLSCWCRWKTNINTATAVLNAVTNLWYSITYCLRFYAAKHVIFCWKNICYNFILVIWKGLLSVRDKWIATCSIVKNIVWISWCFLFL